MQILRALTAAAATLFRAAASAQAPRTFDERPDLTGVWQAMGTADWDLEDHPSEADTKMRTYMGEPRGYWEGSTLVVETTKFIGGKLSINSEDLVLTERLTRVAPNVLEYSVTVNDPKTYTSPWTAPFRSERNWATKSSSTPAAKATIRCATA